LVISQAAKSGSVQCALVKHMPQVPVLVSQCFAPGLVQSPSAPQPHECVCGTQAGPFEFVSQSGWFVSHPQVCVDARHLAPSVLAAQSASVLHPQKFPA
jgi:hypothetical protein